MEKVSKITSEEDLLQLRNEGKITEAEYQDLLTAMQKTVKIDTGPADPEIDKTKSKHKMGKFAFVLMLVGIVLPVVFYRVANAAAQALDANMRAGIAPSWLVLGAAFEIAAFVMGVISWPEVFAKATVVTISVISVIVVLSLLFNWMGVI